MGIEGANVLFDSWVHPLVMGLEEHLLVMFRDDPEFHDEAGASHLGGHGTKGPPAPLVPSEVEAPDPSATLETNGDARSWTPEAEAELRKIPFFVRGKARRNTEAFAATHGLATVELATLYEAKAHYGR
jgi:light-independent protochlorophyllide reductase subunit B